MVASHPPNIQIEVTDRCNCACRFCGVTKGPNGTDMAWETFERVLPLVTPEAIVELYGNGEPLLHPRYLDMLRAIRDRGAIICTSTNGTWVHKLGAEALKEAGLSRITFSICGADAKTQEHFQPGVDSRLVWSNLRACAKAGLLVTGYFHLMRSTIEGLPVFVHRVADSGGVAVELSTIFLSRTHRLGGERLQDLADKSRTRELLEQAQQVAQDRGLLVMQRWGDDIVL